MEQTKHTKYQDQWPTEKKLKPKTGKLDEFGFFHTPNGSFFDVDDEYFNENGFDIHGGFYSQKKEYIPGPDFNEEFGCYNDEVDKYKNMKDALDDDFDEDPDPNMEDFGEIGDFADEEDFKGGNFDFEKMKEEAMKYKESLLKEKQIVSNSQKKTQQDKGQSQNKSNKKKNQKKLKTEKEKKDEEWVTDSD